MKGPERISTFLVALLLALPTAAADTHLAMHDVFGRNLDKRGISLLDLDGYMANPLITNFVTASAQLNFPVTATFED